MPVKGFAAEIHFAVSAALGLVHGRICPELSQYVECYRGFNGFGIAVESLHGNFRFYMKGEEK